MQTADKLCHFLTRHEIEFKRCDHPAVYTCVQAHFLDENAESGSLQGCEAVYKCLKVVGNMVA
jgi:hypothetical protein